jgi:FMN phosphatase YigB (HAD superfamily)
VLKRDSLVFLIDVDNTLLDNDRFAADLTAQLDLAVGNAERERYWGIYAELRDSLGYADYLGALQQFRLHNDDESALLQLSFFLLSYPFHERFYPHGLETIAHMSSIGSPVILSDGDIIFQPRKIQRAGIWDAVDGRVLVYVHKERMLDSVRAQFPAKHYVMVDDKPQLLAAAKRLLGDRVTTVFVRQGHYAADSARVTIDPAPDISVDHIGDLREFTAADFQASTTDHVALAHVEDAFKATPPE